MVKEQLCFLKSLIMWKISKNMRTMTFSDMLRTFHWDPQPTLKNKQSIFLHNAQLSSLDIKKKFISYFEELLKCWAQGTGHVPPVHNPKSCFSFKQTRHNSGNTSQFIFQLSLAFIIIILSYLIQSHRGSFTIFCFAARKIQINSQLPLKRKTKRKVHWRW